MSYEGHAGKKRPRMTQESLMEQGATTAETSKASPNTLSSGSIRLPEPIQRLRLEAIFHPKFENEDRTDQTIRNSMIERVENKLGYLEVTLKHSGSLVLWSGHQRYYSKNSMDNQYTYAAEILVRQHFERAWRNDMSGSTESRYEECSRHLQELRLTLAFEVVTAVLGDHGDRPRKDFVMLTAVADRAQERFYTTTEVIQLAQQFRLPHNDSWTFTSLQAVNSLFRLYDTKRETGLAADTVKWLSNAAEVHVPSMYQHDQFQGDILEGLIIRYVPYTEEQNMEQAKMLMDDLASGASKILAMLPADVPPSFQVGAKNDGKGSTMLSADIRQLSLSTGGFCPKDTEENKFEQSLAHVLANGDERQKFRKFADKSIDLPGLTKHLTDSEDVETRRIAQLLRQVAELKRSVDYFMVQEESADKKSSRWLCVLRIVDDQTFHSFHQEMSPGGMNLFRGFCIEIGGDAAENSERIGMNVDSSPRIPCDQTSNDSLMLKMKFLPYMTRTFICRNKLRVIRLEGTLKFNRLVEDLLTRWGISAPNKKKWTPFLQSWALFAQSCWNSSADESSLPPLTESNYLDYLQKFSTLYKEGKAPVPIEVKYEGTVVVMSPVEDNARKVATLIAKRLEASPGELVPDHLYPGHVCYGSVLEKVPKSVKRALSKASDRLTIVLLGFSDEDIKSQLADDGMQGKASHHGKSWGGYESAELIELQLAVLPVVKNGQTSEEFEDAVNRMLSVVRRDFDERTRGMVVFFPGIPGCGKSTILKSIESKTKGALANMSEPSKDSQRTIHVLEGDESGKSFWSIVKKTRRKDSRCIMIADKNTPPPSLRLVGSLCYDTNGIPVAVIPDASALQTTHVKGASFPDGTTTSDSSHFYPFSLEYLAVCMARVLSRPKGSHGGKLDAGTKNACMILILFFSLYRSISAEEFTKTVQSKVASSGCSAFLEPIVLPFRSDLSKHHLPADLQEVLTEALQLQRGYDIQKKKSKASDKLVQEMESRLRSTIAAHRETLSRITIGVEEAEKGFLEQLVNRVMTLNGGFQEDKRPEIKLTSIDVDRKSIHRFLMDHRVDVTGDFLNTVLAHEIQDVAIRDGCYVGQRFVPRPHITIAHYKETTQSEMKETYGSLQGCEVNVVLTGFLWNESVAAFAAEIDEATLDEKTMPRPKNAFVHITVWFAEGAKAAMANELPSQVASNKARLIEIADPICLTGTVAFWDMKNAPVTI